MYYEMDLQSHKADVSAATNKTWHSHAAGSKSDTFVRLQVYSLIDLFGAKVYCKDPPHCKVV